MQVTIKYQDNDAFVLAEVERNIKHHFGEHARVFIEADSNKPEDIIYFGIQQLITSEHLGIIFDSDAYSHDLAILKTKTWDKLSDILDQVIRDNEIKVK